MLEAALRFAFSQRESRFNSGRANHISDHAPDGVSVVRPRGPSSAPTDPARLNSVNEE